MSTETETETMKTVITWAEMDLVAAPLDDPAEDIVLDVRSSGDVVVGHESESPCRTTDRWRLASPRQALHVEVNDCGGLDPEDPDAHSWAAEHGMAWLADQGCWSIPTHAEAWVALGDAQLQREYADNLPDGWTLAEGENGDVIGLRLDPAVIAAHVERWA